jgi:hypothetical protein
MDEYDLLLMTPLSGKETPVRRRRHRYRARRPIQHLRSTIPETPQAVACLSNCTRSPDTAMA